MTIVDLPMNIIYGVVPFGFALMTFRSVQVALGTGGRAAACSSAPSDDGGLRLTR